VTLFMPPQGHLKDWSDARGQKVCATQGAYFNRTMQERYLLDLKTFNSARDAKLALRNGQCIGFLFDNTAIMNDLAKPEWQGYQAPLAPALTTPWAIAIALRERGSDFEKFLGDTVADWHRSGFLIAREKAWQIPPSRFLADSYELWQKVDADGQALCQRGADGNWIAECRNKVFLTSADVGGLARLGLLLNERSGIDLSIVYDRYDRKKYLLGLALTLFLTALCIAGSLSIGVTGAVLADSSGFLLAGLVKAGSAVGRMTPPLLSIYLLLFGIGAIGGLALPAIPVVIWCLSFYTGSGVMTALIEAAATYRNKHPDYRMRFTTVHDLARLASGSVTASLINVSKATMVASAVAVPELLSAANTISSERGNTGVTMTALLLTFLALIFCVVRLLRRLEALILARYAHV
jgi:polar amino acid transport system substrate-binding protein